MTDRIRRLRQESFDTQPSLSIERALIETEFYKENEGKYPIPILRALNFLEICKRKTIYIGEDELIVGERGPRPKGETADSYIERIAGQLNDRLTQVTRWG